MEVPIAKEAYKTSAWANDIVAQRMQNNLMMSGGLGRGDRFLI